MKLGETKSDEMIIFGHWLRTGHVLSLHAAQERKFNPYHDPEDGRFTFKPSGGSLSSRVPQPRSHTQRPAGSTPSKPIVARNDQTLATPKADEAVKPELILAQFNRNPRVRIGGNNGPPINDPMILEHVFPKLLHRPDGPIVAIADNIFDLSGPSARITADITRGYTNRLIDQIRTVDPTYRFQSLGFPQSFEGQMNQIRQLRVDRATAFYRVKSELRPMQVETLRHLQEQTDRAYARGEAFYRAGKLKVRLSREEAIGNFIDREVRKNLRDFYIRNGIQTSRDGPFRIIGREYESSGTDRTYRIPDARVGNVAFDVSMTRKVHTTPQVRGFFQSDFRPDAVIIVRPTQLGSGSTYRLTSNGN